jgi:hypothetical protein
MNGIYIYDRKSGKPKNLFKNTFEDVGKKSDNSVNNYIHTYRGGYEKNEEEKTIKISGSCGAGCGSEETYQANDDGSLKLIKKCEWNQL